MISLDKEPMAAEVAVEITEADQAVVQAVYGLWEARFALSRLDPSDIMASDLVSLQRDISRVTEQLNRLAAQREIVSGPMV